MPVKTENTQARPKKEMVTYLSNAAVIIAGIVPKKPGSDPKERARGIVFTEIPKRLRDGNIVLDSARYYYVLVPNDHDYWEIRDYIEGRPILNERGEQEQDDNYGPAWATDDFNRKLEPNILWGTTIWTEASKRNQLIDQELSGGGAERLAAIGLWASLKGVDLEKAQKRLDSQKRLTAEIHAESQAILDAKKKAAAEDGEKSESPK